MDAYSEQALVALAIVFSVIPLIFVCLRLWTKKLTPFGIQADDWLSIVALSITIGSSACMLIATIDGDLGSHMIPGPDGEPDLTNPRLPAFEQSKFAFTILTILGLGLAKTSVLVFCRNIVDNRPFRIMIDVLLGIVLSYTVGYVLASIFTCNPVTAYVEPVFGNRCISSAKVQVSSMFVNAGLDFLILFAPVLIAMLRVTANGLHRLGLVAVFALGMLVLAVGVVRVIVTTQVMNPDPELANDLTYINTSLFMWTIIELSLSVLVGCLATLRPLFGVQSMGVPRNPGYTIGYATQVYSSSDAVGNGRWTPLSSLRGGDSDKEDLRMEPPNRKQSETAKFGADLGGIRVERSLNVRAESRQEILAAEARQDSGRITPFQDPHEAHGHKPNCPLAHEHHHPVTHKAHCPLAPTAPTARDPPGHKPNCPLAHEARGPSTHKPDCPLAHEPHYPSHAASCPLGITPGQAV